MDRWSTADPRVYSLWIRIRHRCISPHYKDFPRYGGRGITICKKWLQSFARFAADIGPHPGKGWTLDRKNNDGPYAPGNVRWATWKTQAHNRRNTKLSPKLVAYIRKKYRPVYGAGRALARELGLSEAQ